ncbi:MAG: DUF502 domain-containing protein [Deltaproteobacteria bacterium]|nr:DUF502 domain-containing protein [Deltaproteobacteria bacterium]
MITGVLILIPLFVTYLLIAFLFNLLSNSGTPILRWALSVFGMDSLHWLTPLIPFINLLIVLGLIFLVGVFGTNIVGRRILAAVNQLVMRLPLVSTIYGAVKQLVETLHGPRRTFQRVVLLEYPRKGTWMMGLVATPRPDTFNLSSADTLLAVFIPTTPNPTSGFLVLVPENEVIDTDYNIEEAFKFIVSSGIVGRDFGSPGQGDLPREVPLAAASDKS